MARPSAQRERLNAARPRREGGPATAPLVTLFALALVAFNAPLLMLWDRETAWFGLPPVAVGLFGVWTALIAALAFLVERGRGGGAGDAGAETAGPDPEAPSAAAGALPRRPAARQRGPG